MKDSARASVVAALASEEWADATVSVRVNAPRTPWCHLDIAALAGAAAAARRDRRPEGRERRRPRVRRAAARRRRGGGRPRAAAARAGADRDGRRARARRRRSRAPRARLDALVLGYADLAVSLGRARRGARPTSTRWRTAQELLLLAARAHGLQAIDGPYLGIEVDARFTAAVARARELGFDGKWAIHPSQLPALNEAFTPSDDGGRARARGDRGARAGRARGGRGRRRARRADARRGGPRRGAAHARARREAA